jgi:hypothetical protein
MDNGFGMGDPTKIRVKEAVDRFVARVRHNLDVHLEILVGDLNRAAQEDIAARAEAAGRDAAAAAVVLPASPNAAARLDLLASLVGAMRLLDEAESLRTILDALARGVSAEASRTAVMVVDGGTVRRFADFGYSVGPRPSDVPVDSFSALARAVNEKQRVQLSAAAASFSGDVPAFLRPGTGHSGLVIPVVVGGNVVSLVYAEGPDRLSSPHASVWIEAIELLVRHASSRLENVTSRRTVEVLSTSN